MHISADITVEVGLGGDFLTINSALATISTYRPIFAVTCKVILLNGFVMEEQVILDNDYLSWVTITTQSEEEAAEEIEIVKIVRSALDTEYDERYPAFYIIDSSHAPVINVLFDMDTSGDGEYRDFIFIKNNSMITINEEKGCLNVSGYGALVTNRSFLKGYGSILSGKYGLYSDNGIADLNNSTITHCDYNGIYAKNNSFVFANSADFTVSTYTDNAAIYNESSFIIANDITYTNRKYSMVCSSFGVGSCNNDDTIPKIKSKVHDEGIIFG